jgi:hypothetical protein
MTQANQPADGKGEARPSTGKNQKLEDRIADEKDDELVMLEKNGEEAREAESR